MCVLRIELVSRTVSSEHNLQANLQKHMQMKGAGNIFRTPCMYKFFNVQVSLYQNMKVAKSKKSSLSKKNNSPSFDQRFEFKVL